MSMELFLLRLFFCFCFVTTQCISIIQKVKLIKTHSLTLTAATSNSRQATDKPLKALYSHFTSARYQEMRPTSAGSNLLTRSCYSGSWNHLVSPMYAPLEGETCMKSNCEIEEMAGVNNPSLQS